jgi:hypothetical protein
VLAVAPASAAELTCSAGGGPRAHGRARLQGPRRSLPAGLAAELTPMAAGGACSHDPRRSLLAGPAAELAFMAPVMVHRVWGRMERGEKKEMGGNFTLS